MVGGWAQLNGSGSGEYKLQAGFSGSPVLDASSKVLGIVAQTDDDPVVDAAAYIPVSVLTPTILMATGQRIATLNGVQEPNGPAITDSMTAFVGCTIRGPVRPALVTSWDEFVDMFGDPLPPEDSYLGVAVRGFFGNGGREAYIVRVSSRASTTAQVEIPTDEPEQRLVITARDPGRWGNNLTVRVAEGSRSGVKLTIGIVDDRDGANSNDQSYGILAEYDNLSLDSTGPNPILRRVVSGLCQLSWTDVATASRVLQFGDWTLAGGLDGTLNVDDYTGNSGNGGISELRSLGPQIGLVCLPDAQHPSITEAERTAILDRLVHAAELQFCIALIGISDAADVSALIPPTESPAAACFFPAVRIKCEGSAAAVASPVGHIAGAIARHDLMYGIRVPGGKIELQGLLEEGDGPVTMSLDDSHAESCAGHGINTIREIECERVSVDLSQTTAVDEDLRPLEVVRTLFMIHKALDAGLLWATFEPNNESTWTKIKDRLSDYLTQLWQVGVLSGNTPDEAFLVECDGTTMTEDDIANGRIIPRIHITIDGREFGILDIQIQGSPAI
jgi:phage tail sheath protein FI